MRVITGSARGRRLKELEGMETRPTTDRVKEGMFNALQFDIEDARVLDLFAGTGQLGIECLSRGAAEAVFVDRRGEALRVIRENLKVTALESQAKVISGDSMAFLQSQKGQKYNIILLDPPYAEDLLERAMKTIAEFDILSPYGIMVCEHPEDKSLPELPAAYARGRTYRYGKICFTLFRRAGEESV